jgi:hypothetical protein
MAQLPMGWTLCPRASQSERSGSMRKRDLVTLGAIGIGGMIALWHVLCSADGGPWLWSVACNSLPSGQRYQ